MVLGRMAMKKNPAAVELGRRGGQKKVPKGFAMMTDERRAEIAKRAAAARWGKKRGESKGKKATP
jgi:hypothetical protein